MPCQSYHVYLLEYFLLLFHTYIRLSMQVICQELTVSQIWPQDSTLIVELIALCQRKIKIRLKEGVGIVSQCYLVICLPVKIKLGENFMFLEVLTWLVVTVVLDSQCSRNLIHTDLFWIFALCTLYFLRCEYDTFISQPVEQFSLQFMQFQSNLLLGIGRKVGRPLAW